MKTFYFNTGVTLCNTEGLSAGQIWRNGTKQIPFDCEDVPDNATFLFACDNSEPNSEDVIVRLIHKSTLVSKYAHFNTNKR
jgi:hypothetical protein